MANRRLAHLHRRGDSYYFRRGIPQDVADLFQRSEIKASLGRISRNEARNICRLAPVLFDRMVAKVRFMEYPGKLEIEDLVRDDFTSRLKQLREIVSDSFGSPGASGLDLEQELGLIASALTTDRGRAVQRQYSTSDMNRAERLLANQGLSFKALAPEAKDGACHALLRSDIELHRIYKAMLEGHYDEGQPQDPLFLQSITMDKVGKGSKNPEPASAHKLSDLVEKFIKLKSANDWGPKTQLDHKRVLNWFCENVGGELPVHKIDKDTVIQFRDCLLVLPTNMAKAKKYAGKTLPEIIDSADEDPKLSPKTADKYFSMLKGFLNWCRDEEYISEVPGKKISIPFKNDANGLARIKWRDIFSVRSSHFRKRWVIDTRVPSVGAVDYRSHRYIVQVRLLPAGGIGNWCARPARI